MKFEDVSAKDKIKYNKTVSHPLQSWEWGVFREKTGVKVIRRGGYVNGKLKSGFTLTLHDIPKTSYKIGYLPKGGLPTKSEIEEIVKIGKENKCVFIQIEPNVVKSILGDKGEDVNKQEIKQFEDLRRKKIFDIRNSFHPLFTKYNFILDISRSEEELLSSFHSKSRYNIKVARDKHGVKVVFDSSKSAFNDYMRLLEETTTRQAFYAHTPDYHKKLYEALSHEYLKNSLSYHIARALYTDTSGREHTLACWVLFTFGDTLYYPYGASSDLYRFTMASNLICWESILFGKKLGMKKFDMWGALSDEPDKADPWYGFHRFKSGYNPTHVEYVGSFDIVINSPLYSLYKVADRVRWKYLSLRKRF